jgi:hypothetical protein
VLRGARADVTDFSYMTLMDTSAVKHNMLKGQESNKRKGKTGEGKKSNFIPTMKKKFKHKKKKTNKQ